MAGRIEGDFVITGRLTVGAFDTPTGTIGDAEFTSGDPLTVAKQFHRHQKTYGQAKGAASISDRRVIHVAAGPGVVNNFQAGITVACIGGATITVNLRLNGSVISTTPISISSATANFAKVVAGITVPNYVAGDVFELDAVVAAGGGTIGQGLFCDLSVDEAPA